MTIPIAPYAMGSPAQPKVGTQFEVRYIQYTSPTAVAAAVAVASTHKVTVVIGGVTYYMLATNVP